jgi:hypothetical protein
MERHCDGVDALHLSMPDDLPAELSSKLSSSCLTAVPCCCLYAEVQWLGILSGAAKLERGVEAPGTSRHTQHVCYFLPNRLGCLDASLTLCPALRPLEIVIDVLNGV